MNLKHASWRRSILKLSTDLASVEAATGKLHAASSQNGKLSTDLASVEATTETLLNVKPGCLREDLA